MERLRDKFAAVTTAAEKKAVGDADLKSFIDLSFVKGHFNVPR